MCPEGHHREVRYNSCRHRSCPRCAYKAIDEWLDKKQEMLLPNDHFHVIFTIPAELRPLWAWNSRSMADVLFAVVRETFFEFLDDPRHLGARPGVLAALHSWGGSMVLHPHIHCLVTAGGVTPDGQWKPVRNGFLLPVRAARVVYRGKLLSRLEGLIRSGAFRLPSDWNLGTAMGALRATPRKKWNIRIEERYKHGVGVATYLARYMRGGPIKNSRLLGFDGKKVSFRYGDHRNADAQGRARDGVMELYVEDFVGRWLQHVPKKGQRVIRAYGLYHPAFRERLEHCREACEEEGDRPQRHRKPRDPGRWRNRCPVCRALLVERGRVKPFAFLEQVTGVPPPIVEIAS